MVVLVVSFLVLLTVMTKPWAKVVPKITYLDEYIIEQGMQFQNTTVGGLSSIDYANGHFYMVSDHGGGKRSSILGEPRYYTADIIITDDKIQDVEFSSVTSLLPQNASINGIDPESLRVIGQSNKYIWSSEGSIKNGIAPAVYIAELGKQPTTLSPSFVLPPHFDIKAGFGPRNNAVFEGISLAYDGKGVWVAMEGPLQQDSEEPTLEEGALIRVSYFSFETNQIERQFAYVSDALPHEPTAKKDAFRTTGLVELLQLSEHQFVVMERAYTSGIEDGGNRVKLHLVDISEATDTKNYDALDKTVLESGSIKLANKQLWLDLESIKEEIASKRVDNIEGITFGPKLTSGNKSLLLISDDNFNSFGQQLSQILLLEVSDEL